MKKAQNISSKLVDSNIIMIFGQVDKALSEKICSRLMYIRNKVQTDAKPVIDVYINSPGGSVTDGMAIYDVLKMMEGEGYTIKTTCVGLAASMGSILLLAGTDGHRNITKYGEVLLHQPLIGGVVEGQVTDIQLTAKHMVKTREKLYKVITNTTKQPAEKVAEDCNRDYWLNADESLAYGIVNKIV